MLFLGLLGSLEAGAALAPPGPPCPAQSSPDSRLPSWGPGRCLTSPRVSSGRALSWFHPSRKCHQSGLCASSLPARASPALQERPGCRWWESRVCVGQPCSPVQGGQLPRHPSVASGLMESLPWGAARQLPSDPPPGFGLLRGAGAPSRDRRWGGGGGTPGHTPATLAPSTVQTAPGSLSASPSWGLCTHWDCDVQAAALCLAAGAWPGGERCRNWPEGLGCRLQAECAEGGPQGWAGGRPGRCGQRLHPAGP